MTIAIKALTDNTGGTLDVNSTTVVTIGASGISQGGMAVAGTFKNLQLSATGLSSVVSISADALVVESAVGHSTIVRSVSLSINSASVGVNGLDTGTIAISTWYSVWVIWDGTATAGLLSLSATAPTLPAGYTHFARTGWIRTDATANKFPLRFNQFGRNVQYGVAAGSNVPAMPQIASGLVGSILAPTLVAVGVAQAIPTTAARIRGVLALGDLGGAMVAPNNSYRAYNSTTNPPPCAGNWSANATGNRLSFDFAIESSNIYWATHNVAGQLYCFGWEDSL